MHIEAGVVDSAKMVLGYGTALTSLGFALKLSLDHLKTKGLVSLGIKTVLTTLLVLSFFEILPHKAVGVSEVHLIMGSTLFLLFGVAPAAIGLATGLLIQGLLFAPFDLPQYGMNITTLLVPLFAMSVLAQKIIPNHVAYKDLRYSQVLALSAAFQAGIVTWVAFWAFYGQGFGAANVANVLSFGGAYMTVVLIEPVLDLAVLAIAKHSSEKTGLFETRLHAPASAA